MWSLSAPGADVYCSRARTHARTAQTSAPGSKTCRDDSLFFLIGESVSSQTHIMTGAFPEPAIIEVWIMMGGHVGLISRMETKPRRALQIHTLGRFNGPDLEAL